ncbi:MULTISPECIES: pyridoxamine 5'-phosphate oxidase family protein [Clostridium]|uniref:pyridoxamine 5'-phosphate oxidase family protein n=1 Tax=Clostridium TaxID=1485 RepID=UPI001899A29C|nr:MULTISPECIES: pyridoxamine 5'-phosphate oxidase family protein [Clostridium]MDI9218971.1 pyridoxamine 5'-phosphate oxidase family protein [Clostridium tertium]
MELIQEFIRVINETNRIALATSVDNIPNVRIVNFCNNPQNKGVVYFSSFRSHPKTLELSQNNIVTFTTIPLSLESSEHIRVKNATVKKSNLTIYELKDEFTKKLPGYDDIIEKFGEMLDVYEISFNEATVVLDLGKGGKITL